MNVFFTSCTSLLNALTQSTLSHPKAHNSAILLSRLLLKKGISFCLYRFPNEGNYHLAIENDVLISSGIIPSKKNPVSFIITPFIQNEESTKVVLQTLLPEETDDRFLGFIEQLEDKPIEWHPLPAAGTKEEYLQKLGNYLNDIRSGKLSKAILSRVILLDKPKDLDVFHFYASLSTTYPETFASLFYIPGMGIWTGASPELLLEKENTKYRTMALAATQPKKTAGEYSWRKKEEAEHHLVQQHIEEIFLKNNCSLVYSNGPYTIETGKVAHLKTGYTFEEKAQSNEETIIQQLHPTPAIGGLPVREALECISKYEGYNRNYYSGYLGETNHHDFTRLFINLRCMQIGSEQIAIYVGGGISADSDPEEEWAETNQKSLTLLEIIEETTRQHAQ